MELLSVPHLLIILVIVLVFFGGRRIPEVMKGLGEGIRSFKEGMHGQAANTAPPPAQPAAPAPPAATPTEEKK